MLAVIIIDVTFVVNSVARVVTISACGICVCRLSSLYVPLSSSVFLFLGDEVYFFLFFIIFILFICFVIICYLFLFFVFAGLNWFGT